MGQVVSWERLLEAVAELRRRRGQIVFTNGCFDVLHRGHIAYLTEARDLGDLLIVGLNDDGSVRRVKGPGRPVNALSVRSAALTALPCVDYVCAFSEDTPERLISRIRPDVLAKGGDYRVEEVVGGDLVRAYGGRVMTLTYVQGVSTSGLLKSGTGGGG